MLQGLKFIPRDKVDGGRDDAPDGSRKGKRKSERRKKPKRSKHSRSDSSDDEGLERIKSRSRKKAKWYSSEEELSSYSESSGKSESDHRKSRRRDKRFQKGHDHTGDESPADPEAEYLNEKRIPEDVEGSKSQKNITSMRKEMGLDWMLHSKGNKELPVHPPHSEPMKDSPEVTDNPRELNPYLKNNGSGYPEDTNLVENRNRLLSSSVVGDGGASWRLKALKRAQEQAAREGMKVDEVIQERWGSVDDLAVSVESRKAAPAFAHLHATKGRRKGLFPDEMKQGDEENVDIEKFNGKKGMRDSRQNSQKMRVPRVDQSLSWGKSRRPSMSTPDSAVPSAAISNINKFSNDGSFMDKLKQVVGNADDPVSTSRTFAGRESNESAAPREDADDAGHLKLSGSANQLAARAMQLRLKGKHEEAESIMAEVAKMKERNDASNKSRRPHIDATSSSLIIHDFSERKKNREDDADVHLAQKIARNSRYSISNQADDEYDYDGSPRKKGRKKRGGEASSHEMVKSANRFLTQQERCAFCFDNPARPKHLVVSIANFTYLSLPQQQPLVPGHSCILTLQHELSTRNLDDNVWEEFRNFKKCLIMMYAKQEKEVVFLETVMQLARQRRHCMVECIPLPQNIAKQAPLYFKKAIDEAEEEWSQHNAKKLIDTSEKGLRGSIPKNFPYFHVEFGLKKGFVHVIEDEEEFKGSSFGLNVIRGMLQLPAEDMHRRRRQEPLEAQKQAVASFAREWEPFDWTRQLE